LSTEALTHEIRRVGEATARRFDPKSASPFVNKSVSEATRRAYGRAVREVFQSVGMKHPSEVVPADVVLWRDKLRSQKKSAATIAFKLSVVRSFFEYLKAAGAVTLNPASTKLVQPPELSSEPGGRALSTRMVQKIVKRWADYSRFGDPSPHDLRRTAITRALDSGLTYRQVQMMSKHRDPKTVMRYDHGRENLDLNAVNFLRYEEEGM
jgi:site-specific recombinase XerD